MSWLSRLFGKRDDAGSPPSSRVTKIDPKKMLFSVPTIANDLAALDPIDKPPGRSDVVLGEDDWAQLEFYPRNAQPAIQDQLTKLKAFEAANRKSVGWKNVFVRKIERQPIITIANPLKHLEAIVGVPAGGPAYITSSNTIAGRVRRGFTFDLGGNIQLYGYAADDGIPVLAASVGAKADNMRLASAFMKLHKSDGVMLVDWRAQLLLVGVSTDGNIETWKP
ncbi:MAG: hypothetical protein GC190_05290 [Alphaproteobacteria bacterium]|nr:hypothetical protein [Alphaproteobacteria bacterium]